jgi:hypothetical protein
MHTDTCMVELVRAAIYIARIGLTGHAVGGCRSGWIKCHTNSRFKKSHVGTEPSMGSKPMVNFPCKQ